MILVCTIAMIVISLTSVIIRRCRKTDSEFLFALKNVPLFCIAMAITTLVGFVIGFGAIISVSDSFSRFILLIIFVFPFVNLGFFFWLYVKFAEKKKRILGKAIFHFWSVFALCFFTTVAIIVGSVFHALMFWRGIDLPTKPVCKLEMRRAFSFCPEYERRISFTSGKKVNIQFDTCGLDDFYVFVLNDESLFLECCKDWGESYIVNPKSEKVLTCEPTQEIVDMLKNKKLIGKLDRNRFYEVKENK